MCLGFKGRGRPLWRSSLGSTGLLTSTVGVTSLVHRAVRGPSAWHLGGIEEVGVVEGLGAVGIAS